jgi:hypothetical protein
VTDSEIVDGVPEEFLDAAVDVGWGMGFSHLRRQIAAVMPLHERMVREQVSAEILAAKGTDPRFTEGWASTQDRDHAATIALGAKPETTHPEEETRS